MEGRLADDLGDGYIPFEAAHDPPAVGLQHPASAIGGLHAGNAMARPADRFGQHPPTAGERPRVGEEVAAHLGLADDDPSEVAGASGHDSKGSAWIRRVEPDEGPSVTSLL